MNLLILSAEASAINYIRSLAGRKDVNLFLTDCNKFASGLYSEEVHGILVPPARDIRNYRNELENIIRDYRIDALVPTSDYDMEGIIRLREDGWQPDVKMFLPPINSYNILSHKTKVARHLKSKGFLVPEVYPSTGDVKYPVVVKPAKEAGSKGVAIIHNVQELDIYLPIIQERYGTDIVMQEYIPGEVGSIYVALLLYDSEGSVEGEVVSHSTLTFMTWGGSGNGGELVDEPHLLEISRRMIASAGGWCGPINLEFKRHNKTGDFYLMEVNCRLNGYSYLTTMNGLNFPAAIVQLLNGEKPQHLGFSAIKHHSNFILGYREKAIEQCV